MEFNLKFQSSKPCLVQVLQLVAIAKTINSQLFIVKMIDFTFVIVVTGKFMILVDSLSHIKEYQLVMHHTNSVIAKHIKRHMSITAYFPQKHTAFNVQLKVLKRQNSVPWAKNSFKTLQSKLTKHMLQQGTKLKIWM